MSMTEHQSLTQVDQSARPSNFVNHERLNARLSEMAKIGATPGGGVNRAALTPEDAKAQLQLARWATDLGLFVTRDAIGNLFLRLEGTRTDLSPVLSGSHIDSQPTGGKFDGIYGVIAALEAVQAIVESGCAVSRSVEVVAWVNEEGSRFAPSMMGSGVYAGLRSLDAALHLVDAEGVSVKAALQQLEPLFTSIPMRPMGLPIHRYIEAHIEQGPVLEKDGLEIGVVTGIQGKHTYKVTVTGEAAHAGTAPHKTRKDALLAAAGMVTALATELCDAQDITRFTVGRLNVYPNAPSVVPQEVVFSVDLRHPDRELLEQLSALVPEVCNRMAAPCSAHVERLYTAAPIEFDQRLQQNIEAAARDLGMTYRFMLSAAGHDAGPIQSKYPAGMIFVPSVSGITHNEAELTHPRDLTNGTQVLANVLWSLSME